MYDRWRGKFEADTQLQTVHEWQLLEEEAVRAASLLRVKVPADGCTTPASKASTSESFHKYNARHLLESCSQLHVQPQVGKAPSSTQRLGRIFCCVCFRGLLNAQPGLHVCSDCLPLWEAEKWASCVPRHWSSTQAVGCEDCGWSVQPITATCELASFEQMLHVMEPDELGRGRDAEKGLPPYMRLELKHAWRVEHGHLWSKYHNGKQRVQHDMRLAHTMAGQEAFARFAGKLDDIASALPNAPGPESGQSRLLHGTRPETVLKILDRGMNERLCSGEAAFGVGTYLCENAEKMDQYCRPMTSACALQLKSALLTGSAGSSADVEGLCFCFVVRAATGLSLLTRGLKPDHPTLDCDTAKPIFLTKERRELSQVPGCDPHRPVYFHSLVVNTGKALKRFREIVVMNDTRVYPEYLLAYRRA